MPLTLDHEMGKELGFLNMFLFSAFTGSPSPNPSLSVSEAEAFQQVFH